MVFNDLAQVTSVTVRGYDNYFVSHFRLMYKTERTDFIDYAEVG